MILEQVYANPLGFMLREQTGVYINSTEIIFAFDRIWIGGDLCPNGNGCVSNLNYGIGWFSREHGEDYLASKFGIRRIWEAERCVNSLTEELAEIWHTEAAKAKELESLIQDIRSGVVGEHEAYEFLEGDFGYLIDDGLPGYGYDTNDMKLLSRINKDFSRLYAELGN